LGNKNDYGCASRLSGLWRKYEFRIEGGKDLAPDEKAQVQAMAANLRQVLHGIQEADQLAIARIEGAIELLENDWIEG